MTTKKNKSSRPRKEPTTLIAVPVDCIPLVERMLGRKIACNQIPIIKVRVPTRKVKTIRKIMKGAKS